MDIAADSQDLLEERPSLVGQRIGSYRIGRLLGEGGMGVVYEALHETLGQRVAIKLLHGKLTGDGKTFQRFYNEARAISIVQDPGILKIHDYQQLPDGTAYIVMEFLEGESLHDRLERLRQQEKRLPLPHLLQIARQVASALCAAHAHGIIHCDLKPDNVFLTRDPPLPFGERAKVLDFGIAKFLSGNGGRKTTAGLVLGTPLYMSPEQCEGREQLSDRADVYSLGVMLYEMLSGCPPFQAETASSLMRQHMMRPLPPLSRAAPDAPAALVGLVTRMLAKVGPDRPSMTEVLAGLSPLGEGQEGRQEPARARPVLLAAVVALLLCGVGAVVLLRGKGQRVVPTAPPPAPVARQVGAAVPPQVPVAPRPPEVAPPLPGKPKGPARPARERRRGERSKVVERAVSPIEAAPAPPREEPGAEPPPPPPPRDKPAPPPKKKPYEAFR